MKSRFLSYGAAWIACFTMVSPAALLADAPQKKKAVHDVELTRAGVLSGQILNRQGMPIRTAALTLKSETGVLMSTTNENGEFAFENVGGGTYQLAAGAQLQAVRAWQHQTAPPVATSQLLVVADEPLVRGQYGPGPGPGPMVDGGCAGGCPGGCDPCGGYGCGSFGWLANPWVIGAAVAAAIIIPVALSDDDDDSATP